MKDKVLLILLLLNTCIVFSQSARLKFTADYQISVDDSLVNQLKSISVGINDSFLDDTELCFKFPGGNNALQTYFNENLILPSDAKDLPIVGTVCTSFTVNEKGKVGNIKIERSLCENIDSIVVRVISKMPDWIWDCKEKPRRPILIKRYQRILIEMNTEKK